MTARQQPKSAAGHKRRDNSLLLPKRLNQSSNLLLLRLDYVEQFRGRSLVLFHLGVRVHRLEIEIPGLDFGARDGPTAGARCAGGQQVEEIVEAITREGRFLSDLDVRQVVVPDALRGAGSDWLN